MEVAIKRVGQEESQKGWGSPCNYVQAYRVDRTIILTTENGVVSRFIGLILFLLLEQIIINTEVVFVSNLLNFNLYSGRHSSVSVCNMNRSGFSIQISWQTSLVYALNSIQNFSEQCKGMAVPSASLSSIDILKVAFSKYLLCFNHNLTFVSDSNYACFFL